MLATYRKLLDLMTPAERRRFYGILGIITFSGLAEMLSVAAILPFMAVLADPDILERSHRLAAVYHGLGFTSREGFLVFLGIGVFAVVVFGLLFSTLTQYLIYRFTGMRGYTISSRLLRGYLFQPYTWFLNRHSSTLGTNVLSEVTSVVNQAMMPAMNMLPQAVVAIFLIALLVAVKPLAALVAAGVVIGAYSLIYLWVRQRLARLGQERQRANRQTFRIAGEAVDGIKEVKLLGLEEAYLRQFKGSAQRLAMTNATARIISEMPRNILKAVAFGGILFFILYLLVTSDGSLAAVLPILGVYAFAGLRLFPALQTTLQRRHRGALLPAGAGAAAQGHRPAAGRRGEFPDASGSREHPAAAAAREARTGRRALRLSQCRTDGAQRAQPDRPGQRHRRYRRRYRRRQDHRGRPGARTARTAGGRDPGRRRADHRGEPPRLAEQHRLRAAADFLVDETVSANIAFGQPPEQIDPAAVERAARIAELHDFVTGELPQGYATHVGERGVRLSGGQRQRIGIARALYHDPDVLILDEATSALDNITERAVMDAVRNLGHAKTIVLIAHRLTTVRHCDRIFMLERGRLVGQGSYDELLESSHKFRTMAAGA